jgi:hypothetical protein
MKNRILYLVFLLVFSINTHAQNSYSWKPELLSKKSNLAARYISVAKYDKKNVFSSRMNSITCSQGIEIFIFGGLGINAFGEKKALSDLWKYNTINKTFTCLFVDSSKYSDSIIVSNSHPLFSDDAIIWQSNNSIYLYGGHSNLNQKKIYCSNQLWKFNLEKNAWVLLQGDSLIHTELLAYKINTFSKIPLATKIDYHFISNNNLIVIQSFNKVDAKVKSKYQEIWKLNLLTLEWAKINEKNIEQNSNNSNPELIDRNGLLATPSY